MPGCVGVVGEQSGRPAADRPVHGQVAGRSGTSERSRLLHTAGVGMLAPVRGDVRDRPAVELGQDHHVVRQAEMRSPELMHRHDSTPCRDGQRFLEVGPAVVGGPHRMQGVAHRMVGGPAHHPGLLPSVQCRHWKPACIARHPRKRRARNGRVHVHAGEVDEPAGSRVLQVGSGRRPVADRPGGVVPAHADDRPFGLQRAPAGGRAPGPRRGCGCHAGRENGPAGRPARDARERRRNLDR